VVRYGFISTSSSGDPNLKVGDELLDAYYATPGQARVKFPFEVAV